MAIVQSTSTEGLTATTFTVPTAGVYHLQATVTTPATQTPAASQGAGGGAGTGTGGAAAQLSSVVLTITQTGAGTLLTTTAGSRGFDLIAISCSASDVLTITPSSSSAIDKQTNAIRVTATLTGPN